MIGDYQKQVERMNKNPLNQRCLELLKEVKHQPGLKVLHSLSLMIWTLQNSPKHDWDQTPPVPIGDDELEVTIYRLMERNPEKIQGRIHDPEMGEDLSKMSLEEMQNYLIYNLISSLGERNNFAFVT